MTHPTFLLHAISYSLPRLHHWSSERLPRSHPLVSPEVQQTGKELVFCVCQRVVVARGASLLFSGAYYLIRRGDGTPVPFDPPKRMVVSGPYAHIQHPMIAGLLVVLLGEACWFYSFPLGVYTVAAVLFAHLFVTRREEPILRERFGKDYNAYQAATPRWFPV